MNSILIAIILVPIIEIYLLIKIGSEIGAITTILLIFTTAIVGVYYAKYEGLNTLKSGFLQLSKNEPPTYEVISGAAIAFAAVLLIIPGFATDIFGFLIIFPITRKFLFSFFSLVLFAYFLESFPKINFLLIGKINKNPIISVKNPGIIKSKAAKAIAAPEITSYAGVSFLLNCEKPDLSVFNPSYFA